MIYIEKKESNLALLTKTNIEYANMGPLMNTLKKTFEHSSPKVFEKCNNCLSKLIDLYGRGSIPEGFIPTATRELFYESFLIKEELTPDPTYVPSSTASLDPVTRDFSLVMSHERLLCLHTTIKNL